MDMQPTMKKAREALKRAGIWFEALPTHARTHWKGVVGAALALVVLSIGLLAMALNGKAPIAPALLGISDTPESVDGRERALDGVLVDPSAAHLMPLGVMVENSADAWPLSGPAKANLVFEAPVEGSITRFFLLFDAATTVSEIGPVRSARPYFVEWANGLSAFYGHVGGSPDALDLIASLNGFRDVNEFYKGWAFWRASNRTAPHNVMTRTDLLLQIAEKKEFEIGSFDAWTYEDKDLPAEAAVDTLNVPYQGTYAAHWSYDVETGLYTRHDWNWSIVRDADGTPVTATNVVLILTDATVLDDVGRLKLRTTGSGKALIAHRGEVREAIWSRDTGKHIQFSGVDGSETAFARGTTWISTVTNADAFGTILSE